MHVFQKKKNCTPVFFICNFLFKEQREKNKTLEHLVQITKYACNHFGSFVGDNFFKNMCYKETILNR